MRRRKKKSGAAKVVKVFFVFILLPLLVGVIVGGGYAIKKGVPSISELKEPQGIPGTIIYADDDIRIGEIKEKEGVYIPLKRVPPSIINAVVAVEDSNFWKHKGIDYPAIIRAALKDILSRRLKEGGSTITQQLAKVTFLTPEKTLKRKLTEFFLATRIERNLSKEEILELYLNRVYFGHGAYGVEMASKLYFGKSASDIALPEAAMLAGLLKAPARYSPFRDLKRAGDRQKVVLSRMKSEEFITEKEFEAATKTPVYLSRQSAENMANNYFLDYIKEYLIGKYGEEAVYRGGLSVHTTLDRAAQIEAQRALREGLRDVDKRRGWRGPIDRKETSGKEEAEEVFRNILPNEGDIVTGVATSVKEREARIKVSGVTGKLSFEDALWAMNVFDSKRQQTKTLSNFTLKKILAPGDVVKVRVKTVAKDGIDLSLEQEPEVQGALIAIDPSTGYIRALVGGYDYTKSEFNRALYAERQPGSAFKPIIFATALDNGFTPASIVVDEEIKYVNGPGNVWQPKNFDGEYHGPTRLREALAYSRNVVTVKLLESIGVDKAIKGAKAIGIDSRMPYDLTLALGSLSVKPVDLAFGYAVFANGGMRVAPVSIKYITDRRGRVVESNEPETERVMDQQTAFLVTSMLEDVVNYGTGRRVKAIGRPVAGKTGTTNDYRDAWFIGYTPDMLTGVWVGFDDTRPLGSEETGSRAAAPVWLDFMKAVSTGEPRAFQPPEGIIRRFIDPQTGLLANEWTTTPLYEYFKSGTEPMESSPTIWKVKEMDTLF